MCKECELNPVYEFTNQRKLCKNCFINWFQKKFLYILRRFEMIEKEDVLLHKSSGNFRDAVLSDLLKDFESRSTCKIVSSGKYNKEIISNTLDIETRNVVNSLFEGKGIGESSPVIGNKIKPLYLFLDKEVMIYSKLRNLKFNQEKVNLNEFEELIESLEKKHPEIKQAIMNSYLELE